MMPALDSTDKKWRLLRAWASRHPVWCGWQVTYRCNLRCRFCSYWRDPMGARPEQTPDHFAVGARKLARAGSLLISLAGGEPLLRSDLPDIVAEVGRYHFPFITTNGWLVTPQRARRLMQAGLWGASVSIDYADAQRHDRARGRNGTWQRAWRAVEILGRARVHKWQRVNVIAVLMEDNLEDMPKLLAMAAQHRAYFMVQPYGHRKTGSRAHACRQPGVAPRLVRLRRAWKNFLSNPWYLGRFDEFLRGGVAGCLAGRALFNIDSTGDVARCVESRTHPVANLFGDHPTTIFRRLRASAANNGCMDCWYNCRGEVEALYRPYGLLKSLPTLLLDRGAARGSNRPVADPRAAPGHKP